MCLSMFRFHTNSSRSYASSLVTPTRLQVQFNNPDKLYDCHLKLILLPYYHLENFETVHLYQLHTAEWNKLHDFILKSASLSLCKTLFNKTYLLKINYD